MKFDDKLAKANPGDEIVYHEGYHCLAPDGYVKRTANAKSAYDAYLRGDVLLYQRRIREGVLHYCAKVIR